MNIPNILTILRIFLIPVYLYFFYSSLENRILYAGIIFIIAGISDVLDGHIARKYNKITKLGSVLDPFADKMMTFAVLISFTSAKLIPSWILMAIGLKEVLMILGGFILYLFKGNQVLPANKYGKVATLSFYAATLSVVFRMPSIISKLLFFTTVILNITAFINYFIIYLSMRNNTI
ncbi:CDP-diacylglycerol--glycerol-3-phosphate 3-phosphatidyltransferase [Tissierella sp. MSJ-40]|uniref:CDP-diacylglycerol--glycerol-3-phosphate 3-phosphatidyltransferase n=1 Tax=Tissierella simiarum TaxID=2841534 RepID=A0ABS6E818_9FIRM|nr:CDP-diacylglycerol--glycerol-3-phosphate 3-phosphatidyltransferase [Tissierella simiarum]MBU5439049.1 CDP-diacylglycerol--glycerol-3-phosphate 3-phosphatidyltransferase [Tissierella simiarum]